MGSERWTRTFRFSILAQLGLLSACSGQTVEPEKPRDGRPKGEVTEPDGSPMEQPIGERTDVQHRPTALTCESAPVDDQAVIDDPNIGGECKSKADCTEKEHGYCAIVGGQIYQTECRYGCETDADCTEGQLCDCGPNVGTCVPASCRSDSDCGGDARCLRIVEQDSCADGFGSSTYYKCESSADTCILDGDCKAPAVCLSNQEDARSCRERQLCGIGRPFLVAGKTRLAELSRRSDFVENLGGDLMRLREGLDSQQLSLLADGWGKIALMEHASIAAFARFQLQLLSLGAPAALVEATNQALADETRHARLAFELSSVFSGQAMGPGPLRIDQALLDVSLEEIAELVLLEGCIGETCAALEARRVADDCADGLLRAILLEVSCDEGRHADLAWQFVGWACEQVPGLAERLLARASAVAEEQKAQVASSKRRHPTAKGRDEDWQKAYGLFPESERKKVRSQVLDDVVMPCLSALRGRAHAA